MLFRSRLRLIFTCCHPALAVEARVALTLRTLTGLSTAEIARAFLVPEATMAKRLVRAKHKIANARIQPPEADTCLRILISREPDRTRHPWTMADERPNEPTCPAR